MYSDYDSEDHVATPSEAMREYARNVGQDQTDTAWILTDYDTWEPNPFYVGPACGRIHPDDWNEEIDDLHLNCDTVCLQGYGAVFYGPIHFIGHTSVSDDDLPF